MISPGIVFLIALVVFLIVELRFKLPLPVSLLIASVVMALLAGFGFPFRHLVEGTFGYLYLVLVLFVGAVFGHVMSVSGAAESVARVVDRVAVGRAWLLLTVAAVLVFAMGMFAGIGGVAVLATGVFAVPLLRRARMSNVDVAAFIALQATFGMIAPPINVPAMVIADGVNMPYAKFELSLLVLSVPPAIFTIWYFLSRIRRRTAAALVTASGQESIPESATPPAVGAVAASPEQPEHVGRYDGLLGFLPLIVVMAIWILIRIFPATLKDPSTPLVLLAGTVVALPVLFSRRHKLRGRPTSKVSLYQVLAGPIMLLGAVLAAVGVMVQIMTLTGVRGWLVINAMSLPAGWIYLGIVLGLPILGGVLTSIGTANVLGVPFAFAFIHQDMIINASALSAIASLAEFFPPTAISAILAAYLVEEKGIKRVFRASVVPLVVLLVLALGLLIFALRLTPFLT